MSSWVNILAGAVLLAAGAVLAYVGLWLKGRGMRKARDLEAEAILTKARNEAEIIVRDARLAASDDAQRCALKSSVLGGENDLDDVSARQPDRPGFSVERDFIEA